MTAAGTLPAIRRAGAGPFQTILTGHKRVRRAAACGSRLTATPPGAGVLRRSGDRRMRTNVVVAFIPAGRR